MSYRSKLLSWYELIRGKVASEPIAGMFLRPDAQLRASMLLTRVILWSVACGFLFSLIQPTSSSNFSFLQSWPFWALHFLAGFSIILVAEYALLQSSIRRAFRALIVLSLLPFTLAPVSMWLDDSFSAIDTGEPQIEGGWAQYFGEVVQIAPLSILISGFAIYLVNLLVVKNSSADPPHDADETGINLSQLLGVPENLGDDLIRVEAQDHYSEVITANGTNLLSTSFSDCLQTLVDFDGVQTHRSHWVILSHIVSLGPEGSAHKCVLTNGDQVPVSRRRYSLLKHVLNAQIKI